MNTKTALISRQCRLREWAAMIQDCQNRPAGMGVAEWCANHSITVANYYVKVKSYALASRGICETL